MLEGDLDYIHQVKLSFCRTVLKANISWRREYLIVERTVWFRGRELLAKKEQDIACIPSIVVCQIDRFIR